MQTQDDKDASAEVETQIKALQTDPQCYCGRPREIGRPELLCSGCSRWFHVACLTCPLGTCVAFMTNYHFSCKNCSSTGAEQFNKKQTSYNQMCFTAMVNLRLQNPTRTVFSRDSDLIPYVEAYWDSLTTQPKRNQKAHLWHTAMMRAIQKDENFVVDETSSAPDALVGLRRLELSKIAPNYEQFRALTSHIRADVHAGGGSAKLANAAAGSSKAGKRGGANKAAAAADRDAFGFGAGAGPGALANSGPGLSGPGAGSGSGAWRKRADGERAERSRVTVHGYPVEHPMNKDGFRYALAEADPHAPGRQIFFDDDVAWPAGKPIPGYMYRAYVSPELLLSMNDRAHQLRLTEDRLQLTGEKGYATVRATHSARGGSYFFELSIVSMPDSGAVRVGFAQKLANLQAPLGFDSFGYSYRSRFGSRFHRARGTHYGDEFGAGDTIGCLIVLPKTYQSAHSPFTSADQLPQTYKEKPLVKFKNHYYYEEKDNVTEAERQLRLLPGSQIQFFKNGVPQGIAFESLNDGAYFPAVSLYKAVIVQFNFGPSFKYPPSRSHLTTASDCRMECDNTSDDSASQAAESEAVKHKYSAKLPVRAADWQPFSDRVNESIVELLLNELLFFVENKDSLISDSNSAHAASGSY